MQVNASEPKKPVLLKLNIPFCVHAHGFGEQPLIRGLDTRRLHFYAMALQREIEANAREFSDCVVRAIHLGGGQASALKGEDLFALVQTVLEHYDVDDGAPVTIQASLLDINGGKMPFFRRAGITRYDFEVASLECRDFPNLDYPDTTMWLPEVSYMIHAYENRNMGFVILYGKNSITETNFRRSLLAFTRSNASHLTLRRYVGKDASDDETCARQLEQARTLLSENGCLEYLPLYFAPRGHEDAYARYEAGGMDIISFGMGARTRFDGVETENTMDIETYFLYSADYRRITAHVEPISTG